MQGLRTILRLTKDSQPPLEAPWTGLRRPGERAMEGPFSPSATGRRVGTARSEQPRPGLARRAPPRGGPFFGTFLWASKERYSPARDAGRSKCASCGGRNSAQACPLAKDQVVQAPVKAPFNNRWSPFSPAMRLGLSNRRQRKRASHFSCLCKKSNQKNTPPRDRPSGKPWPDLLQPGRSEFERRTRQGLGHECPKP